MADRLGTVVLDENVLPIRSLRLADGCLRIHAAGRARTHITSGTHLYAVLDPDGREVAVHRQHLDLGPRGARPGDGVDFTSTIRVTHVEGWGHRG